MILLFVRLNHIVHTALQNTFNDLIRYNGLNNNTLSTPKNPNTWINGWMDGKEVI